MYILFDSDIAQSLEDRYCVLPLPNLPVKDKVLTCFCLVPSDRIPLNEHPTLEQLKRSHRVLVEQYEQKNYSKVEEMLGHLYGKFGGELDSFYQYVLSEIKTK